MIALRVALLAGAVALAIPSAGRAQSPAPMPPMTAPTPKIFTLPVNATTLAGLPRMTVSATDEHGNTATYSGVSLHDLLVHAGAPTGMGVRGKVMLSYVVIGASDNYHVVIALPEIDPSFTDHVVLIADQRNGAPIGTADGPYRLVVPFEKRDARWVKNVTTITLTNAAP